VPTGTTREVLNIAPLVGLVLLLLKVEPVPVNGAKTPLGARSKTRELEPPVSGKRLPLIFRIASCPTPP
jgi:hypothetical protein